ncbi:MAG: hypothetical protein IJZ42_07305 [Lachnospiraceae bacterium]|nr:hypothetical protein [Lachnospiraceae bacterium]
MKKIYKKPLIISFIVILIIAGIFIIWNSNQPKEGLSFYIPYKYDIATGWQYELSEDDIIQEVDDVDYDLSSGNYIQYWRFEPVNQGTVTINFTYVYQTEIIEEEGFSITYRVDENNNIEMVSEENLKEGKVEFVKAPLELFWIKCRHYFMMTLKIIAVLILSLFDI